MYHLYPWYIWFIRNATDTKIIASGAIAPSRGPLGNKGSDSLRKLKDPDVTLL